MQAVMSAITTNPAIALATGLVAGALLVLIVQALRNLQRKPTNPLQGLFQSDAYDRRIDAIVDQRTFAQRSGAVLRARVDHLPQVEQLWGQDTRNSAIEQVAQVMRAGVRKSDGVSTSQADHAGKGSTIEILTPNASEAEAGVIARRLLDALSHMPMPGMAPDMRVSASFGVAERREGESDAEMRERAEAALTEAQAEGEDHVVTASEWEEIKLLPSPTPSADDSSQAA